MINNILVGIVTYNPEIERLSRNLRKLNKQEMNKIVIVDNGSSNIKEIEKIAKEQCCIKKNTINMGIAYALNQIGQEAEKYKCQFFLTLDQDSIVDNQFLKKTLEIINSTDLNSIGMICPYINRYNDFVCQNRVEYVESAITSGSLVLTKVWKEIGGFWNYLFIDEVDHEFCYRMKKYGYKILKNYTCCINHIIGEPDANMKVVLGHKFHPTNHSPFRRYYMTRNSILMLYLYPNEKDPFPHRIRMLIRIFISISLCEKEKIKKYKAMYNGIKDAFIWIIGHKKKEIFIK